MAIGDKALAAGFPIVDGNAPNSAPQIDDYINTTRDLLADEQTSRKTGDDKKLDKPTDGAQMARREPGSAHSIGFYTTSDSSLWFRPVSTTSQFDRRLISQGEVDAAVNGAVSGVYGGSLSPAIFDRGTSGQWRSLAVQQNGVLAQTASARRFKENIEPLDVTDEQLAGIRTVTFDWIESGDHDFGVIADEVADAGLEHFVTRTEDGEIQGVHYERLALALLPVVQRLVNRVTELEANR